MKRVVFVGVLFLLIMPIALADNFQELNIRIDVQDNLVKEYVSGTFSPDNEMKFSYRLPVEPEGLSVDGGELVQKGNEWGIVFDKTIKPNEKFEFDFNFDNPDLLTETSKDNKLLSFSYIAQENIDNFKLSIVLPEEATIAEKGGLLVSRPVFISTNGRRIFLEWEKELKKGEEFSAFVQYEKSSEESLSPIIFAVVIFVVLVAGLFAGYRLKKFKKEKFIEGVVGEDEKKIVNELKKKKEILQEDLRDFGWTKTKVSKVVRRLEMKGIIVKIPYRKTNKLRLK